MLGCVVGGTAGAGIVSGGLSSKADIRTFFSPSCDFEKLSPDILFFKILNNGKMLIIIIIITTTKRKTEGYDRHYVCYDYYYC
jgi:hypothetical protein